MATRPADAEIERRWAAWLVDRNRRSSMIVLVLIGIFYPLFGVLDYMVAPPEWLWLLYGSRGVVTAVTVLMFFLVRGPLFPRHGTLLTAAYMTLVGFGIAVMVAVMGGHASPYATGLILVMITAGTLFLWPGKVAAVMHSTVLASFLLPNLASFDMSKLQGGITNFFFLGTTATIMIAAQAFAYKGQRKQVTDQILLERTTLNLERAHKQLKELDRFRAQVFANITHELKTPLTMILASLELMGELGSLSAEQQATVESMSANGLKLLKMIGDILDLSKLDDSRVRLHVAEHDFVGYLRDMTEQVRSLAQRKRISLSFACEQEACPVHCDLEQMERVFVNLLSNAAKFTPEGGCITVSLYDEGDAVLVEVADSGPGFPPDQAEALFDRFHQVEMSSTRRYGGTGIGLALAKELVELHVGRIWARNRPEGGAVFSVRMPRARDRFPAGVLDRRVRRRSVQRGQRASDLGLADWAAELTQRQEFRLLDIAAATERRLVQRHRHQEEHRHAVLAVDDVPDVLRVISLALQDSFKVYTASDGEQGLERARRLLPSLIVTDLMMPGIDGLELVQRLRADPATSQIPIIMLSARGDLEDRVEGLKRGVNAYLPKPFSPRELRTAVGSLLKVEDRRTDAQLRRRMEGLDSLAAGISHEFNNALNQIRPALEILGRDATQLARLVAEFQGTAPSADRQKRLGKLSSRVARMQSRADAGATRMARMVQFMADYARAGYERSRQRYDLFQCAVETVDVLTRSMDSVVEVSTKMEGPGAVDGYPAELLQVVTNLIQNAMEAAAEGGGHVWVRGRRAGERVVLTVRDDGPGVDPAMRERVFDPFFSTKAPGSGTGLGLNIAWRVARSHGGSVELHSPDQGATFVLSLPAAAEGEAARAIEPAAEA